MPKSMGAKLYAAAMLAAVAAAGCAQFQRLAPPGLVKYEELAGDQPPNPVIVQRIAERRRTTEARFPELSEQPAARPEGLSEAERAAFAAALDAEREALQRAVEKARADAEAERADSYGLPGEREEARRALDKVAEDLAERVARDREAARRERAQRPAPQN